MKPQDQEEVKEKQAPRRGAKQKKNEERIRLIVAQELEKIMNTLQDKIKNKEVISSSILVQ